MLYGIHTSAMTPAEAALLPALSAAPAVDVPVRVLSPLAKALLYAPGIVLPGGAFVHPSRRNKGKKQRNGL